MNSKNFFSELKRRNVYKVAVVYAIVGWLLIQVATQVFPFFEIPNWSVRLLVVLLLFGFPIALILAWAFELTPEGIKRSEAVSPNESITRRTGAKLTALIVLVAVVAAVLLLLQLTRHKPAVATGNPAAASAVPKATLEVIPEKSIAVLPFQNLSSDKENAYFADGIQDEILTRLAKIADLKVISRTSTQQYQSKPGNLSEIAKQLGVANILEGSVQKVADQVRVNVQLIQAASDSHLWADTYDRKLIDIFGVESEVAKAIAESLQAKLTGGEQRALAVKPTNNSEAYDAYLRGLAFEARLTSSLGDSEKAIGFYERAVQLDPAFALAWARLSRANAQMYFGGLDTTPARRDATERTLNTAQKLQPNSPETLLAQAYYQYWVLRDYELAKATFGRVRELLPGSSDVPGALAAIARRQGHWDESVAYWEQTLALDPRNTRWLANAAATYSMLRQFPAALKTYDRVLDLVPNDPDSVAAEAAIYQAEGNLEQAGQLLAVVNAQTPSFNAFIAKMNQLFLERHFDEAIRLTHSRLTESRDMPDIERLFNTFFLVLAQKNAGDIAGARATAQQLLPPLETLCQKVPDNPLFASALSLIHAVLGQKDAAIKESDRAITLLPSGKDAVDGPTYEEQLASVEVLVGDKDRAIPRLQRLLEIPYRDCLTPALLRLDPRWDPLRGDPRFQKLCEEKKP
jgi:TolB-like protein/regulator of sirC expression with transglutaminase-like and TPR domain